MAKANDGSIPQGEEVRKIRIGHIQGESFREIDLHPERIFIGRAHINETCRSGWAYRIDLETGTGHGGNIAQSIFWEKGYIGVGGDRIGSLWGTGPIPGRSRYHIGGNAPNQGNRGYRGTIVH